MVNKLRNNHVNIIVMLSKQNVEMLNSISLTIDSLYILQKKNNEKIFFIYLMFIKIEDLKFNQTIN